MPLAGFSYLQQHLPSCDPPHSCLVCFLFLSFYFLNPVFLHLLSANQSVFCFFSPLLSIFLSHPSLSLFVLYFTLRIPLLSRPAYTDNLFQVLMSSTDTRATVQMCRPRCWEKRLRMAEDLKRNWWFPTRLYFPPCFLLLIQTVHPQLSSPCSTASRIRNREDASHCS